MEDFVTVKSSDFEADLVVARSYLLDNGIECAINGEYLSVSTSEGEAIRLEVRAEDYTRAMDLLFKGGFIKAEEF